MKVGHEVLVEGYHRDLLCGGFSMVLHTALELTIVANDVAIQMEFTEVMRRLKE